MERIVEVVSVYSSFVVPMLAVWAVLGLYSIGSGRRCYVSECAYFVSLLLIAGVTLRTVTSNHDCWLVHTASLGVMIVAGVMRRPVELQELDDLILNDVGGVQASEI